jgi:hypothetical protein
MKNQLLPPCLTIALAPRPDGEKRHFFNRRHFGHGYAHAGIGPADEHVQAILIGPLAKFRCADVRLVLVVDAEHDDFLAEHRTPGVGDRHVDGLDAALTLDIRIDPG